MLSEQDLSTLRRRCLKATRLGSTIANAQAIIDSLEDEAGGADVPKGAAAGSAKHILNMVGKVQAARSGAAAKPKKAKAKKATKKKAKAEVEAAPEAPAEEPTEDAPAAEDAPPTEE